MNAYTIQMRLGLTAIVASAFLLLIAIPNWVTSPSNVRNIVLSPTFWPYVLSGLTGLVGVGLVLAAFREAKDGPRFDEPVRDPRQAGIRLAIMTLIMLIITLGTASIGMVWMSMAAFIATAALVRTRHPVAAVICGILLPLALYAFFAHVASVAIPQGNLVRLP
ncbi:tripartite tricarboxylate transporter TctB family protein [Paracoccus seriniphilus]|uniref:Tripartite tricarboxylate transporter TctB family protein n=1 Tax=Paracoccus seriniphilus TaxID=184748 RepID=A0A239Q0J5_9RHOB|nr:tripartite tricarboxylate transporter TctB family protein [Paracoccus seriniphilus]WCR16029.1 tripartite tricarboxylate transporter TctB family protein [Paracoccus seriniphilus]SNT75427.1 Tripartite tricarboxylate transporter TctB family protein [Paracoccus seriniphilus]